MTYIKITVNTELLEIKQDLCRMEKNTSEQNISN